MGVYDTADERFGHQIPEPFRNTVTHHHHWRESLFFVAHPAERSGDVVILTLAHFPARGEMDSLQLGHWQGKPTFARHTRHVVGDHDDWRVGPVTIEVLEPKRVVRLQVAESDAAPLSLELTFTARTAPYALRRGTMKAGHEIIWDQSHMFQSGWFDGTVTRDGTTTPISRWLGQRDHSWGIRTHNRCPMWMWLAIQLPEGMIGVWCWELPNGARIYTDGCLAPSDGSEPTPIVEFRHDLTWVDATGNPASYERFGESVAGLTGQIEIVLAGGRRIGVHAQGTWAQRYDAFNPGKSDSFGGGLNQMSVVTSDGQEGTAIYELTGQWHHRYFPIARGERLPPEGLTPGETERA